ncbi:hypothetical protein [Henriciella litoralis]|uniref:hypothetical protein n=1 Tax=Henriciella litoralis TaxID=568102 RepID=UPI000A059FB8|nr:hypothetical protein [Henriciella litoralis]
MSFLTAFLVKASTAVAARTEPVVNSLSAGGKDVLSERMQNAILAGNFPVQTAFVVVGCLLISGFVLLVRETHIENKRRQHP